MTIRGVDPSGELGKLFQHIQSKTIHGQDASQPRLARNHPSTDAVDLSTLVREIRDHTHRVAQEPDVRLEKIQQIQQTLDAKGVLATPEQVADALTRELLLNELSF